MLECVLTQAAERHASDIHMTVGRPPTLRVYGELVSLGGMPASREDMDSLLMALLPEDQLECLSERGDCDCALTVEPFGRVRINVYREHGRPALAIRRIPTEPPTLKHLGLPESLASLCDQRRGLVLVTGPTGSGKSSTLAALVRHINTTSRRHIVTLEDPIEFEHRSIQSLISQREIGRDVVTFSAGLRAALRQDPDVILVGEMRDTETIAAALQAAETGHLVLATLHSTDAVGTVDRIINGFPADQQPRARVQLATTLQAVISQRLLRRIDRPGLVPATEVLLANGAVRNLIATGNTRQIQTAMQTGQREGHRTFAASLQDLAARGIVQSEERALL